jgi:glycosyltransferase involved in cell wall biosynthesis
MPRVLKILLLIPHLGGGGAEKVTALLARKLSSEKYEIHLGLITQTGSGAETFPPWVTVHGLGARRVRAGMFRLLRLIRRLRPDVILSGMAHLNFLVLLLRPLFPRDTRVLVRQNGTVSSALAFGGLPWYSRWLYRLLYPRADRIICQSCAMADDLAAELGIEKNRIAILPNPVDFDGIRAAARASPRMPTAWSGAGPHLLAIGRLAPEKGFDLLLQALVPVREQHPNAELILLGSGPEEPALKSLCRSLGIEAAVRFSGTVQQPYDFYSGASLFVLPSRHEGMPNALLEAAVAGLPIVATPASGGIADLLSALQGTWLAHETSAAALAAALLEALGRLGPAQRFSRSFPPAQSAKSAELPATGAFAFETAIAAYEQLIDSACERTEGNHVALVIPTLDRIAGAERHVMLLAAGLRRRGWRVSVVALSGSGGAAAGELTGDGVAFLSLGMRKGLADLRGWVRFIRWLRRTRPGVVHAHLPHAAWLARWSRLCAPIPALIDTLHSSSTGTAGRRLGYRVGRRLPDRVVAVSRAVADSHLAAGMVNRATLTVLPNGVDVDHWRPDEQARLALRRELGLADEFLWLAVGRLETVKDYPTLLAAMAAADAAAQLVIAGCGPLLGSLQELSIRLGLLERVRFLGFVPDPRRWFQAADGFVLASRLEGLPMALLEAAACGLPAVATDVPGTREAVLHGVTGMLAPAADPSALAAAMHALTQTGCDARRAMGSRARQHVTQHFSLAATLDRAEELYGELLGKKARAAAHGCATTSESPRPSASHPGDAV